MTVPNKEDFIPYTMNTLTMFGDVGDACDVTIVSLDAACQSCVGGVPFIEFAYDLKALLRHIGNFFGVGTNFVLCSESYECKDMN